MKPVPGSGAMFGMTDEEYAEHITALVRAAPAMSQERRDEVRIIMRRYAREQLRRRQPE